MDDVMKALADGTRRQLLLALTEHNPQPASPIDLPEDAPFEEVERRQIELYHKHLPMLDDLGFVEWDREARQVAKGPQFDDLRPVLDTEDDIADSVDSSNPSEKGQP